MWLRLPDLLMARDQQAGKSEQKAKSCILLFATGGPAQQETFDPKPNADVALRGEFSAIATSVPGLHISELLPLTAKQAHRYSIIRSTFHEGGGLHGAGVHYNLTGMKYSPRAGEPQVSRRDPPCIGGAIRYLRGDQRGMPASVHLPVRIGDENNFLWGGQHAGYLGERYDPLTLIDENWTPGALPPSFPKRRLDRRRLDDRVELLAQLQTAGQVIESERVESYKVARDQAMAVLHSTSAWEAFRLEQEPANTIERYGDNKFGRSCLVARRLVEAGVSLVTVPWMYVKSTENFDTHKNHFKVMKQMLMPPVDRAFSALLEDLAERGLSDETLVAWTGDFGRTPIINKHAGRDHWPNVYSTVLAGGGIRGGYVHGCSDRNAAEPKEDRVHVSDFVATIYHVLGYAPGTVIHDMSGRPRSLVEGKPVRELLG